MRTRLVSTLPLAPILAFGLLAGRAPAQTLPRVPIGMNIHSNNYYSPPIFLDAMKAAGDWMTFNAQGDSPWSTGHQGLIPMDSLGYPMEIPVAVGGRDQAVRCMLNDFYEGEHAVLHDGEGDLSVGGVPSIRRNGTLYVTFSGKGGGAWLEMRRSLRGNPVRNLRIVPASGIQGGTGAFLPGFLKGLQPMQALRFMDWMNTNGSTQKRWSDRVTRDHYTQGGERGMSVDYAIELANTLKADAWFCMPHQADDGYLLRFASLVKERLDPALKAYVEYSNEIWNWQFEQAHYVGKNAPGNADSVVQALRAVGAAYCKGSEEYCHPEKDAYMMDRTFRQWRSVFTGRDTARMVRVAGVQHAWYDNTGRILEYLFTRGKGCDAIAPAGYFNFEERHHKAWLAMGATRVTPEMILDSVFAIFDSTSGRWTRESARYARKYKVDFLVYEGGQHMQPYMQGQHPYDEALWEAHVHPRMYDLYMRNFREHAAPEVDCRLFMAFSYVGARKSRWGSWGHLENYRQLEDMGRIKTAAPKYAALLDANVPRRITGPGRIPRILAAGGRGPEIRSLGRRLEVSWLMPGNGPVAFRILRPDGSEVLSLPVSQDGRIWRGSWNTGRTAGGLYFLEARSGEAAMRRALLIP